MRVDGHENTESRHQRHHRCATVTDQRQRDADHRQYAGHHSGIDEYIHEKCQADAAGSQPGKGILGFHRDIQPAGNDKQVCTQNCQHAKQTEFFTQYREYEIGGSLR